MPETSPRPGWFERERKRTEEAIAHWPDDLRAAAGMPLKPRLPRGTYWYVMPNWRNRVRVEVYDKAGLTWVRFKKGYYPSRLEDLPKEAKFELIQGYPEHEHNPNSE